MHEMKSVRASSFQPHLHPTHAISLADGAPQVVEGGHLNCPRRRCQESCVVDPEANDR